MNEARLLVEQGRPVEARELLLEEFSAHPSPAVAFNLALVQHGLGDYEAAVALFEQLLSGGFQAPGSPPLSGTRRQRTTELLGLSTAELGTVILEWRGTGTVTWRANGRPRGTVGSGESLRLRLNPGTYVVSARTEAGENITREVVLARADVVRVTLSSSETSSETSPETSQASSATAPVTPEGLSPWPWVVLGVALVPLGTAVVSGLLVDTAVGDARSASDQREALQHANRADQYALVANLSYGVAAAVGLAGLVWGIVELSGGDEESDVSLQVGLGSISLSHRF